KKAVKIIGDAGMPAEEFGYAVKKGNSELLGKINASLDKIMNMPLWNELIEKYKLNDSH
ncbi:MAG: amino acid ABC transporter substrate-binding protein, partial [Desulfobulbus propionicus]